VQTYIGHPILTASSKWVIGFSRLPIALLISLLLLHTACTGKAEQSFLDTPRLTPNVEMRDITFHSAALERDMHYRALLPKGLVSGQKLPVVYLLHGGGADFRSWSNDSDVSHFAEDRLILIMPEGNSSYYTNSSDRPKDKYEDYIVTDLISDVESRFPAAAGRNNRAIVGVSMGGFGAVKLALKHPELFIFVGGMSSAVDVPRRRFSIKRIQQWRDHSSIFGPIGSSTRFSNDPFNLVRSAAPSRAPYFFLSCGEQEGLLGPNREFAALLEQRHFKHEFHTFHGAHNWNQWNSHLGELFQSLFEHMNAKNN
jgi:S-formylglutathione hydrolase FrmB